ncbi:hypothetical protein HK405_014399 [Cladochytrium tenue]|nr:hypothetical protein HK405_014399 [Cladochytrium tenue]
MQFLLLGLLPLLLLLVRPAASATTRTAASNITYSHGSYTVRVLPVAHCSVPAVQPAACLASGDGGGGSSGCSCLHPLPELQLPPPAPCPALPADQAANGQEVPAVVLLRVAAVGRDGMETDLRAGDVVGGRDGLRVDAVVSASSAAAMAAIETVPPGAPPQLAHGADATFLVRVPLPPGQQQQHQPHQPQPVQLRVGLTVRRASCERGGDGGDGADTCGASAQRVVVVFVDGCVVAGGPQ